MKKISETSAIPSHSTAWPYVKIDDETCDWVRIPTPGEVQDALSAADEFTGAARVEAQLGATIALGWRSHLYTLEADTPRGVYRELHDAGLKLEAIVSIASKITDLFRESTTTDAEVEAAADFSEGTQPIG